MTDVIHIFRPMFHPVSVVIISNHTTGNIEKTIASAEKISDDIIVMLNGNNQSQYTGNNLRARVIETHWLGFGATKNFGNQQARHNWILSLDADEELDEVSVQTIQNLDLANEKKVFAIKRLNYFGDKLVHHGAWKNDWVLRLFNKNFVSWNDALVHEKLLLPPTAIVQKINGRLHHYTVSNIEAYNQKLDAYAILMAEKYSSEGKIANLPTMYLAAAFNFAKNYFVRMGWLDKKSGLKIAIAHAQYTFKKYAHLRRLTQKKINTPSLVKESK